EALKYISLAIHLAARLRRVGRYDNRGVYVAQRLRKLSRATTSPDARSAGFSGGRSVGADGASSGTGKVPDVAGATSGTANSSAKLTDGSAKLRTAANGITRRSSCF